jgi:radical SAM superfamily enzyme YgiQ (UPF0313 family)
VQSVLQELHHIRENTPVNYVIFLDDTFTLDRGWVEEFCWAYGREIGTGFSINARADTVSLAMISMLAKAGCKHIVYGVESGNPRVRGEILKRPGNNRQFVDAFRWTKEAGILATANYMIGIPGETEEDIRATLALNEELTPDDFCCFVYYPYPGTQLFEKCFKQGYLPDNHSELPIDNGESILHLPNLTREDIKKYYILFAEIREKNYLKRYGGGLNVHDKAIALKTLRGENACCG